MEFSNVTFRFPEDDEPVLQDVSFSIQQGERVVITGAKRERKKHATVSYEPLVSGEL